MLELSVVVKLRGVAMINKCKRKRKNLILCVSYKEKRYE